MHNYNAQNIVPLIHEWKRNGIGQIISIEGKNAFQWIVRIDEQNGNSRSITFPNRVMARKYYKTLTKY